ncbi:MAG: hypothetical protein JWP81_3216 [Ferruginibacter sp.]|nr:hypothetical protein [Ferruginibacter sp.]
MILKLKSSLAFILCSVLFFSCQKEYSLEGHVLASTAVFTFAGTPGSCTNALVTGTYQPGVALGTTNVATLSVNVTTAGTYTVVTTTVNGIAFSGTGTFSSTGLQTITLTGNGTPLAAGTFSYSPTTTGCSFPVTVAGTTGSAVFTLNGAPGNCTGATTGGTYTSGTALGAANTATVNVNVTTIGTYNITTNTVNGITFSAAGTFSATGNQPIQLRGSGTPLAAGTFNYIPGATGCTFSITVTGGAGAAVFTYGGAPNACTSATPAGTFITAVPLTAANTVTVGVNVTTPGTYSISTPVVNGISFAASGSFAAAGATTVVLVGTGTPLAAGIFNYIPTNNGCSFPVTVVDGFLTCTIDGVARTFNMDIAGDRSGTDTIDVTGYETAAANSPVFLLRIVKSPLITTGVYNRPTAANPTNYGVGGYFNDATVANGWITALSTQTGPFSITVSTLTTTPARITGTFSGTLYDNNGTGTTAKIITVGQFNVPYQ